MGTPSNDCSHSLATQGGGGGKILCTAWGEGVENSLLWGRGQKFFEVKFKTA